MTRNLLGIIGGTGLTRLANLEITHRQVVRTPYGEPSGALIFGRLRGHEVVFLARHGYGHTIPPHEVNYRANLWALHDQGVRRVVSFASVGGIHADLLPGAIVTPDQIIDYTHGRAGTYAVPGEKRVSHLDFTEPYCAEMRTAILDAARTAGVACRDGGVYAAVQGPRLETAAEINRLERDGADMVGMTGMPEAVLAREIGLCYAALCAVANHAAGRGPNRRGLNPEEIERTVQDTLPSLLAVLECLVECEYGIAHGGA
jgi:5'-methylthioadenosine phosphorylase